VPFVKGRREKRPHEAHAPYVLPEAVEERPVLDGLLELAGDVEGGGAARGGGVGARVGARERDLEGEAEELHPGEPARGRGGRQLPSAVFFPPPAAGQRRVEAAQVDPVEVEADQADHHVALQRRRPHRVEHGLAHDPQVRGRAAGDERVPEVEAAPELHLHPRRRGRLLGGLVRDQGHAPRRLATAVQALPVLEIVARGAAVSVGHEEERVRIVQHVARRVLVRGPHAGQVGEDGIVVVSVTGGVDQGRLNASLLYDGARSLWYILG